MKINLNQLVKYRPTEKGFQCLLDDYEAHDQYYKAFIDPPERPVVDEDGYAETQLWKLMQTYGKHLNGGFDLPIETEIVLIKQDNE